MSTFMPHLPRTNYVTNASSSQVALGSVHSSCVHFECCLHLLHPLHCLFLHWICVFLLLIALLVELRVPHHPRASVVKFHEVEISNGGGGDGEIGRVCYMSRRGGRGRELECDCVLHTNYINRWLDDD